MPRLLIVDDDVSIQRALASAAQSLGFETYETDAPEDVCRRLQEWKPIALVCDLQMPSMDGIALLRKVAEAEFRPKVVLISGLGEKLLHLSESVARELGLDVIGALKKPFRLHEVRELLLNLKETAQVSAVELRAAIDERQIKVLFQPICSMAPNECISVEALARWQHPVRGWISPEVFVSIAEQRELAGPLMKLVMEQTVEAMTLWSQMGICSEASVNMSAKNLTDPDLPDDLERICKASGVRCEQLTLELTETQSMKVSTQAIETLIRLRLKGFHLSIDDFGTGFSSLQRLRELPFSEIKIDKSFISKICHDRDSAVIAETIIALAKKMGLVCVAEGIEDLETMERLREWGCDLGQGYYFGKAMGAEAVLTWFNDYSRKAVA